MSRRTDPARNRIQPSLLASLQAGVAALERSAPPVSSPIARSAAPSRAVRTTLSVPKEVGEHARRLALALTLHDQREATLGHTLQRALGLLEDQLRAAGASIPETTVELRSGPRSR